MDPKDFEDTATGRCVKAREIGLGEYWAFVPNPLPPQIEYDQTLSQYLSEADRMLGELSGTGRVLPNPYFLIAPYIRREAVSSSKIEGTITSLSDLFLYEASEPKKPPVPDVAEVRNYVRAMEYGIKRVKDLPVSTRLIREIHEILMEGVRGEDRRLGEIRQRQNWVGPLACKVTEATYVPPPVREMNEALTEWERYLHGDSTEPPLVQCALMHYQFEAIHPFLDGNGRVGRLMITFFLCERGFLSQPLLYLSAFFEKYRAEYYDRLVAVSQQGAWRGWVEFFLQGITTQAQDALSDAKEILDLNAKYHRMLDEIKKRPIHTRRLIDEIFLNPIISVGKISDKWNMDFKSVQRSVDKLVEVGVLEEITGKERGRLFRARKLHELLTQK